MVYRYVLDVCRDKKGAPMGDENIAYIDLDTCDGQVGEGSHSRVCRCKIDADGAEKEIACKIADSEDRREYLEHEATFLLENRNPNILKCYGLYTWSEDQGTVFMLTELFPQDLEKVLTSGTYEVDDMGGWMCEQLVNAVRFLHRETFEGRGAMHLDIKPENILVDMDEKRLVMCDFGTVRENKPCDAETGSEMYYAPEMFDVSY